MEVATSRQVAISLVGLTEPGMILPATKGYGVTDREFSAGHRYP